MYSGQVAFTAINSQNVASEEDQNGCPGDETKSLQDRERQSASPGIITAEPCSPKSIYQVANQVCFAPPGDIGTNNFFPQVGLTRLCDIAFKDIQSQLDENNILEELFSPFTAESVISKPTIADCANEIPHASHERVREMEHELFQSKLKPLVDGAPLYDIIESSSLGEHPHRAAVMELILERSVRRCRKGTLSEAKDTPRPDSAPQPKRGSLVLNTPAQQVRPVSKAHSRTGMQSLRWQISQLRVRRSPLCLLFQLHHEVRWLRKYQVSMRQPLHQLSRKVPVQVIFMSRQRSSPTRSVVPIAGTSNQ